MKKVKNQKQNKNKMKKAIAVFLLAALFTSCTEVATENVETTEEVTVEVDTTSQVEVAVENDSIEGDSVEVAN